LGWRRGGHLCRVADNTVWSHWQVASRSSEVNFAKNYTLLFTFLFISQWWGKWNSNLVHVSGTGAPPKVNWFLQLVGPAAHNIKFQLNQLITFSVIVLTEWQNKQKDRKNDHVTSALSVEVIILLFSTVLIISKWKPTKFDKTPSTDRW